MRRVDWTEALTGHLQVSDEDRQKLQEEQLKRQENEWRRPVIKKIVYESSTTRIENDDYLSDDENDGANNDVLIDILMYYSKCDPIFESLSVTDLTEKHRTKNYTSTDPIINEFVNDFCQEYYARDLGSQRPARDLGSQRPKKNNKNKNKNYTDEDRQLILNRTIHAIEKRSILDTKHRSRDF
jgi:hypothetical protein